VAQAQGMVAVEANCSLDEALGLMAAEAESSNTTIDEVAALVVDGVIRFDP
jgi:hypothetical protein